MSQATLPGLQSLLADYSVFYQKLRVFHWTVKGPMFFQLHAKFEEMYQSAALNVDAIAERIVGLGARPLGRLADHVAQATLQEDQGTTEPAAMVRALSEDQARLIAALRASSAQAAESADMLTANLLEEMADAEEKTAWMLEAYLA